MSTDCFLRKRPCNHLKSLLNLSHKIQWNNVLFVPGINSNMENTPQAYHCDAQIGGSLIWEDRHAI